MKFKNTVTLGLLTAISAALQIFEGMIPFMVQIPGGKLGLANIVTLVVTVVFGGKAAVTVALIRSLLASLAFGGFVSGIYSVTAAVCSALITVILYKRCGGLSLVGIGVISALVHNLAQVIVAVVIMHNAYIMTYYPVLMLVAVPCGIVTGYAAQLILKNNVIFKIKR